MNYCNYLLGFLCFLLASLSGFYYYENQYQANKSTDSIFIDKTNNKTNYTSVKILGAVNKPGTVTILNHPPRIIDAIQAAGGLSAYANFDIPDLAETIENVELISVPFFYESEVVIIKKQGKTDKNLNLTQTTKQQQYFTEANNTKMPKININSASQKELMLLPGIGEVISDRIILQRSIKPLTNQKDLLKIKGIGKKKLAKILPLIDF